MSTRLWATIAVLLLLGASCAKAPCDPPYSCPDSPDGGVVFIDCMPPSDGSPECAGTCNAWLAESCPNVRFVY